MDPFQPNIVAIPDNQFIRTMLMYDRTLTSADIDYYKLLLINKLNDKESFKKHHLVAGLMGTVFVIKYEV